MNAVTQVITGELYDDAQQFFAPVSTDMVSDLVAQYQAERARVEEFANQFKEADLSTVLGYFFKGNHTDKNTSSTPNLHRVMKVEGAIAALNSSFWAKTLSLTDLYELMPQNRRKEWNEQIENHKTPDFEEDTVRSTLKTLLADRAKFFAERVDGIFRALSREHVTNCPEGFSKRMIIYIFDDYGFRKYHNIGHLTDLRKVIAKFMGRDEPQHGTTDDIAKVCRESTGEWVRIDAGSMRMKVFKKGTAHLEVHPDMAWRLNAILANLYPNAIPSSFRTKPARKSKTFTMMERPLPFAVLGMLSRIEKGFERDPESPEWDKRYRRVDNVASYRSSYGSDKAIRKEADAVLEAIGGVRMKCGDYKFDYDYRPVLDMVITTGCIPHKQSHQFYPTPVNIAEDVIALAEIEAGHTCLEPSAGTGGIADHIPECKHLTCVEISKLHCEVLRAKGHYTICGDFLKIPEKTGAARFERVVMNPPYSEGRWKAHTEAAAGLVAPGGRLVSILPSSARNKFELPGFTCTWSKIYENAFAGASVDVCILVAAKD